MFRLKMQPFRRILAVLLLLALGLGTPSYAMPSGDMAQLVMMSDGTEDMAGMAGNHDMPDECASCINDAAMSACVSVCLGVQAIMPATGASIGLVADVFDRLPQQSIGSSAIPPEPYPPKLLA